MQTMKYFRSITSVLHIALFVSYAYADERVLKGGTPTASAVVMMSPNDADIVSTNNIVKEKLFIESIPANKDILVEKRTQNLSPSSGEGILRVDHRKKSKKIRTSETLLTTTSEAQIPETSEPTTENSILMEEKEEKKREKELREKIVFPESSNTAITTSSSTSIVTATENTKKN